jgi:hypothetical protein
MNKKMFSLAVALAIVSLAGAGTFTFQPWTSDADSGVSAGKIYTHAVKFQYTEGAPVYAGNGAWFEGDNNTQGTNWRLWNIPNTWGPGGNPTNITGFGANLTGTSSATSFVYGDNGTTPPQLILSNLTPGTKYVATFYAKGWGAAGGRFVDVIASDDPNDPGSTIRIDQDKNGGGNGLLLKYAYTAPKSGQISFTFDAVNNGNSWHHYAFSNEVDSPAYVYIQPDPAPGKLMDLTANLNFTAIPLPGVTVTNPTYDLYWGTDPAQLTKVAGLTAGSYQLQGLTEATKYYWKVEVFDGGNRIYSSDPGNLNTAWTFTTKSYSPATKVVEYPMDDPNGLNVYEIIGNYNGTIINPDDPNETVNYYMPGLIGNSLLLDGIDSYVDLGNTAPLPFGAGKAYSISAYIKTTDAEGPIIAFRNSTALDAGDKILCLAVGFNGANSTPGKLSYISRYNGNLLQMTGPEVNDGGWNHVVLSRAIDGTVSLYLNGKFAASLNDNLVPYDVDMRSLGADLLWIRDGLGAEQRRFYNGSMDTVTIWDGALKQSQIDEMVNVIPYRLSPKPADGAKADLNVTLSWGVPIDRYANATYNVYLGNSPDLTNSIDGATGLTSPQFKPTEPLDYENQYYWKVETVVDGAVVYTSPTWSFVTVAGTVGRFSVQNWTGDGDSRIGTYKTYTHKVNFYGPGEDGALINAGNGVFFENDMTRSGTNWSLINVPNDFSWATHTPAIPTGDCGNLVRKFYFGENGKPVLTLTGLTLGTKYVTTLYAVSFGGPGERFVNITPSDNPDNPTRIDQNATAGQLVKYTYTATATEMSFTFLAENPANTWHHYAFSNEIAVLFDIDPTPASRSTVGTDVVLSWVPDPVGAAQGVTWNLLLGTDPTMAATLVNVTGLTEATYTPSGLEPDTQYYWTVQGVRNAQVVATAPVWSFFTKSVKAATTLAEWKFDDATGTTVKESFMGLNGTLTNFNDPNNPNTWPKGVQNTALKFDGVDDYVNLPDTTPLTAPAGFAFSLSGYFRTTDSNGPIYTMRSPGILAVCVGYDGADSVPGYFRFISYTFGGLRRITGPKVDDGLWHHFAVTRSKFGQVALFVDGVSYGTTDDFAGEYVNAWSAFGTDKQWLVDGQSTADNMHLAGNIDQFTIWADVLQPDQIQALVAKLPTPGDLNGDGSVNLADLMILANGWLTATTPADINLSGRADMEDFDILSQDWGK